MSQPRSPEKPLSPGASVIDREVRVYVDKRVAFEEMQAQADAAKKEYEDQKDRLWDVLEANGLKTVNHDLGRFTRTENIRGYVKDELLLERELEKAGLLSGARSLKWKQKLLNQLAKDGIEGEALESLYIDQQKRLTYTPRRAAAEAMETDTTD